MLFLAGLTLVFMKLALNITSPRQWTLQQTVTDAYLTYEKALAQRLPFTDLVAASSPWPVYPEKAQSTVVLGKLPGGSEVTGTIIRTRTPDTNNYPVNGGSGDVASNPAGIQIWSFQSILSYKIGGRDYVKTRTVIRSQ